MITGLISISNFSNAQCFQIESILVDACGSPEGENEMVRMKVGNQNMNVNSLSISWPNNNFQGFCSNSQTGSKVAQMNATVLTCGYFVEPEFGVIPANSDVLIITSEDFDPSSHNYNGLQDTLVVIFQCGGNTQGHFANWTNSCDPLAGDRTLVISSGSSCTQTVTYNRCSLVNQMGGTGGSSAERDGAKVDFDVNGQATYTNEGCTIPYDPLLVEIDFLGSNGEICSAGNLEVSASIVGVYSNPVWESQSGSFSNQNGLLTIYSPDVNSTDHYIYFNIENGCGDIISDSLLIEVIAQPICSNGIVASHKICVGDSVELNYVSENNILWNTGSNEESIFVSKEGYYTVTASNNCGSCIDSFYVEIVEVDANFDLSTYYGPAPLVVEVENYVYNGNDNWFVNNSGVPYESSFLFDSEGTYDIELEKMDGESGCSDILIQTVIVEGVSPQLNPEIFEIPNVFTPNQDGENDVFGFTIQNDYTVEVVILNRWGNIVKEADIDVNAGSFVKLWDGSVNNSIANDGVYFYKLKVTSKIGSQVQDFQGYVHLFH